MVDPSRKNGFCVYYGSLIAVMDISWLMENRNVLHAKDISMQQSEDERGKVTGTPVGCACGEGVIDWKKVVDVCKTLSRDIVFSVECGTIDQAERSISHLKGLL